MRRINKKKAALLLSLSCWKYNLEFWHGARHRAKFQLGVPIYYRMLGKKFFGSGIKYPLFRFAGLPDRFMRKHLYLDFTGYKRTSRLMKPFDKEIVPGFESVRGLDMVDASQLHHSTPRQSRRH